MTTEIEPVRSQSPELAAMTLPKLKTVATQLGVDGAAKMKKDALVEAIADFRQRTAKLQRLNAKHAAKHVTTVRRIRSLPITHRIQMMMAMIHHQFHKQTMTVVAVMSALIATTVVVDVTVIVIATAIVLHAKSASQLSVKMMF